MKEHDAEGVWVGKVGRYLASTELGHEVSGLGGDEAPQTREPFADVLRRGAGERKRVRELAGDSIASTQNTTTTGTGARSTGPNHDVTSFVLFTTHSALSDSPKRGRGPRLFAASVDSSEHNSQAQERTPPRAPTHTQNRNVTK